MYVLYLDESGDFNNWKENKNFVIAGMWHRLDQTTKEPIIPLLPYTKNTGVVPFSPFTDYKNGKECKDNTKYYWKPLSEFLFAYADHNDNKYAGEIGELRGRQVVINEIEHIGKESNNLEESEIIGISDSYYVIYGNKIEQKIEDAIKNMTSKDAKRIGLSKRHLFRLKKEIQRGKRLVLMKKTIKKLSEVV